MEALGRVFDMVTTLRELNLGDNALSLEGGKILAPQLAWFLSLKVLHLNNTGACDGAKRRDALTRCTDTLRF
jgi:Ran GTPase-activating protein (RanGAP) involved in mRNA processing and transport